MMPAWAKRWRLRALETVARCVPFALLVLRIILRWLPPALLALGIAAPFLLPSFQVQLTFLWIMIVFALCWDILGGQMGYNSFGNIAFFGIGVYTATIVQIGLFQDVAAYTAAAGMQTISLTPDQYFEGLFIGLAAAPVLAVIVAVVLGLALLDLRGHYFAIATLGLGIAAGELAAAWTFVGGSSGVQVPVYPGSLQSGRLLFYFLSAALCITTFITLRWLYTTRFGLAINAIRDDEDKAEALGLHTTRYKIIAWCIGAVFLGLAGGLVGHIIGFIDPREVAFAGASFGVWMILMAILGGKGTLWGPVIGAVIFHVMRELFWTYLFGWQNVAMGVLIVVVVVFFPFGILGWLRRRYPQLFVRDAAQSGAAE
ncbi:MAG TPA: branched-chain amino acid ABC transporter permease [Candidatus Acidoferrum sp.]|nr:branched-chain amino acid ABC transporter permease [Candidatus Acidoferrum sp.]